LPNAAVLIGAPPGPAFSTQDCNTLDYATLVFLSLLDSGLLLPVSADLLTDPEYGCP